MACSSALSSRLPRGGGTLKKTEPPERLAPPAQTQFQGDDPGQAPGAGGRQGEGFVSFTGSRKLFGPL